MTQFTGNTENAKAPFLAAAFWKKGKRVEGTVTSTFDTENGKSWTLELSKPVEVDGAQEKKISVGSLKGLAMAIRDSGAKELEVGDIVIIECTGTTPTNKGNDQIDFKVAINRKNF